MELSRIGELRNNIKIDGLSNEEIITKIAQILEPKFQLNSENRKFYNQLLYYFTNDSKYDGDLKKGLLLLGGFGSGKTLAMDIFQLFGFVKQIKKTFVTYDTDEIIDLFVEHGRPSIDHFNHHGDILIDELGQDSGKHYHFGSIDDPVDVLIGRRYKSFKSYGKLTHAISNLNINELEERFSCKIYDRMCEMFNPFPFTGESWRRKK